MKITIQSKYVKAGENIRNGDIAKIKDEGVYKSGKYGPQLEFRLELPNKEIKLYTPNTQTQLNLMQEFGSDSKEWIDKPLKVWVFEQVKNNEVRLQLILAPQDWDKPIKKEEMSEFPYNASNGEGEELVDVKKIPF